MRKLLWVLLAIAAVIGIYYLWSSRFNDTMRLSDYEKAQRFMTNKQYDDAFELIKEHRDEFSENPNVKADWLNLAIRTVEMMPQQTGALVGLYEKYPQSFQHHELASLLVAGDLLSNKKIDEYQKLRDSWKDHSRTPEDWFVLDSDLLLLQGKPDQAKELLLSKTFEGSADTKRLVRLSLLHPDNLSASWEFLQQAELKDPNNPTVQSLKGKLMEDMNQSDLSETAFQRALELDPTNVVLIDQLGEYYRRQGNFDLAMNTWKKGLDLPKSNTLWYKVLFWNKVYLPQLVHYMPPKNTLIDYLQSLDTNVYWNTVEFDRLPKASTYLKSEQLTFWLPLIQKLVRRDLDQAQLQLQYNPFITHSWSPQIEQALRHALAYRENGNFDPDPILNQQTSKIKHPFFDQLSSAAYHSQHTLTREKIPVDLKSLLRSDEVFSAIFLAGGWNEAAIYLHKVPVYPPDFPDWVAVEYTKALRKNRGKQAALSFALSQKQTDALKNLIKELSTTVSSEN